MTDFSEKLSEIKTILSSSSSSSSFAYLSLLHLQQQSNGDNESCILALVQSSHTILQFIVSDVVYTYNDDEETLTLALKCLGFMIYHPVIVAAITEEDATVVIESLARVITTTKIKSVCNLGVWCISVQQLNASILSAHFQSLLRAVIHAIDNPIGSLSTAYEAIQAVMKLSTQLSENMRDTVDVWVPPIYRRLVSTDKRERDISERCLLKVKSNIFPSPSNLAKVLVHDLKQRLLSELNELLLRGLKIQAMQAWGWFIRILGPHAMKNRSLVNEMLKIPQLAFSDHDPQLQIAALVTWEGVIDALIHPPLRCCENNIPTEISVQYTGSCKDNCNRKDVDKSLKNIKLVMTPLTGIMSSKCDVSVHSVCLNTWSYLLQKLDTSISDPSGVKVVLEPIFEAVFRTEPNSKNIRSWNLCLDLLGDFISSGRRNFDSDPNNKAMIHIKSISTIPNKFPWMNYSIKWLPWDLTQLDFSIKMIDFILSQGTTTVSSDYKSFVYDAALKSFTSILKGIQIEFKRPSVKFDEKILCLNSVLQFLKKVCEDVTSEYAGSSDLHHIYLRFIEAVTEELDLSILGSSLYKVALDLKYPDNFQSVEENRHVKMLAIRSVAYMDMVSPLVYLTTLHLSLVMQWSSYSLNMGIILQDLQRYLKCLLSAHDSLESVHVAISLIFKYIKPSSLKIWVSISNAIGDFINGGNDVSLLKLLVDSNGYCDLAHLLIYPFVVCSCSEKEPPLATSTELDLQHVIEVWNSLYGSANCVSKFDCSTINRCTDNLYSMIHICTDSTTSMPDSNIDLSSSDRNRDHDIYALFGSALVCIMEHVASAKMATSEIRYHDEAGDKTCGRTGTVLRLAARFMTWPWIKKEACPPALPLFSRVISALSRLVGCLHWKQDIQSFVEIISAPLLQSLSCHDEQDESTLHQLQLLWTETLNTLLKSRPPITFNSSFLRLQAPLLEKTLDHPYPMISKPTITFWNSTYGRQVNLDYPQSLLHVLDKLSRNGKINLKQRYKVTATHNQSSKRVGFVEDIDVDRDHIHNSNVQSSMKRKRLELTDHQREVRRAQQGKDRDCNGHGPGVRTYTSMDFSQVNDESQDSEDFRKF